MAALLRAPTVETDPEPSVIVLRGPAFGGLHVIELAQRGTDRRGWRLVVDGRPGGNLAVGVVVNILQRMQNHPRMEIQP